MLPSLAQLSVNSTEVSAQDIPPEIWLTVLNVIDNSVRSQEGADRAWSRNIIMDYVEALDARFSRLCETSTEFRNLCAGNPSIWASIVEREREVMITRLTMLQQSEATQTRPRYTFRRIDDFVQLFKEQVNIDLNNIPPNLRRLDAMRLLVLMFGSPLWASQFMWVRAPGEEEPEDVYERDPSPD
jgi:hypothetical protein